MLMDEVVVKSALIAAHLRAIAEAFPSHVTGMRGRGMMQGLVFDTGDRARRAQALCFARGLIVETCGCDDDVLKILCPLTIGTDDLVSGLEILASAAGQVAA